METKMLPIGVEDFSALVKENYYFIDKTLFIKDLLDSRGVVNLFTRPRRFGKTLNLSMLRCFFERCDKENDNRSLFNGLNIEKAGGTYFSHFAAYPVINLTLKSAKQARWELAYDQMIDTIVQEYRRHIDILQKKILLDFEVEEYMNIVNRKADEGRYLTAIKFLSQCLEKVYGKKTVILIDEYDVPLENAYFSGFYDQMIGLIRAMFESGLKTNPSLAFAVLTGCLRISRESIFTGLNNLAVNSIRNKMYSEHFGFTQGDVEQMLADYELSDQLAEIGRWYDGYLFGDTEVYNPWSLINYVRDKRQGERTPKPYWSNTSGNSIVISLLEQMKGGTGEDLELLISGGTIEAPIRDEITYQEIYNSTNNLWNFLYLTGYLTTVKEERRGLNDWMTLRIPNDEVKYIYENQISIWFEGMMSKEHNILYQAILSGNADTAEEEINKILFQSISYMDSLEAFYHGIIAGIFAGITSHGYRMVSNRESGVGRPDLLLIPADIKKPGVVMEFKVAKTADEMEICSQIAVRQIQEGKYDGELKQNGCGKIFKYGISFHRKNCKVLCEEQE